MRSTFFDFCIKPSQALYKSTFNGVQKFYRSEFYKGTNWSTVSRICLNKSKLCCEYFVFIKAYVYYNKGSTQHGICTQIVNDSPVALFFVYEFPRNLTWIHFQIAVLKPVGRFSSEKVTLHKHCQISTITSSLDRPYSVQLLDQTEAYT